MTESEPTPGREAGLRALERRVSDLEDERAINDLLARYGLYADMGLRDAWVDLFTEDARIEAHGGDHSGRYGEYVVWEGRDSVRELIMDKDVHGQIEGRSMHLPALSSRIEIDGDHATAETSACVLVKEDGAEKAIYEASFSRWTFRRDEGRWRIQERVRYSMGTPGYRGNST